MANWTDESFRKCLTDGHSRYLDVIDLLSQALQRSAPSPEAQESARQLLPSREEQKSVFQISDTALSKSELSDPIFRNADRPDKWTIFRSKMGRLMLEECPGSTFSLLDLFIRPRLQYTDNIKRDASLIRFLPTELQRNEDRREREVSEVQVAIDATIAISSWIRRARKSTDTLCIVRGGPGSGKSTFAKALASERALLDIGKSWEAISVHQVLFIQLQQVPRRVRSFEQILNWYLADRNLFPMGPPDLSEFSSDKKLLLILDGLDEIDSETHASIDDSVELVESVQSWLDSQNKLEVSTLAIVLGRTVLLQNMAPRIRIPKRLSFEILPLNLSGLRLIGPEEIVNSDYRYRWWERWTNISGSKDSTLPRRFLLGSLGELTREPLLLYLVSISKFEEEDLSPSASKYELYAALVGRVLRNWHRQTRGKRGSHAELNAIRLELQAVAISCLRGGGRTTSLSDVKSILHVIDQENHKRPKIEKEGGILTTMLSFYLSYSSSSRPDRIGIEFTHKSFAEFFVAEYLARISRQVLLEKKELTVSSFESLLPVSDEVFRFFKEAVATWDQSEIAAAQKVALELIGRFKAESEPFPVGEVSTMDHAPRTDELLPIDVLLAVLDKGSCSLTELWRPDWKEHSARELLRHIMALPDDVKWRWRYRYTSFVPEHHRPGAKLLRYIDFSEQSLAGLRLVGLDFFGSSFAGSDLRNTDFIDCNLSSVDFTEANLQGTRWFGSSLSSAQFENSQIGGADFRFAANLSQSQLVYAVRE